MRSRLQLSLSALCLLALFVSNSCAKSKARDTIRIVALAPDTQTSLSVGATVDVAADVEYDLTTHDSAALTLFVQAGESATRALAKDAIVVKRGRSRATLQVRVTVPDTKTLDLFVTMLFQDQKESTVVDSRFYAVTKR